jgi:hypothetical protein
MARGIEELMNERKGGWAEKLTVNYNSINYCNMVKWAVIYDFTNSKEKKAVLWQEAATRSSSNSTVPTFLWFHSTLTLGFPRRKSAWSTTSSCMRDAEWIISAIMATCL